MLALTLGLCGYARAQVAPPPPGDDAAITAARTHLTQAIALYNDGNFSAALAEFKAAYDTKPAPSILYNIGLTYKALFQYNEAIETLSQYERDEKSLAPERRAEVDQLVAEMRALLANVGLAITPEGADIRVDGRLIGHSPMPQYAMAAGRHVIEVSHDGYVSKSRDLMITAGVPIAIAIELPVIPKTGRLRIAVTPAEALVRVDGRLVTPPLDLELPLGGHTLEAVQRGYQVHREEVLIAAGQTRELSVRLQRPPIYKRAALWVPLVVGIVAVAAIGTGVGIAVNEDHPITGTLTPGKSQVGR